MGSYIVPMSRAETEQYMKFRLMVADASEELFDEEGYDFIYSYSGGICREVSKLADNALMEAFIRGESKVTIKTLELSNINMI